MKQLAIQMRLPVVTRAHELWNERGCALGEAVTQAIEESPLTFTVEAWTEIALEVCVLQFQAGVLPSNKESN